MNPTPAAGAAGAVEPPLPPGFAPLRIGGGFIIANGPLYLSLQPPQVKLGLRVEERHCNLMGICHGGMMATFCDMLLPMIVHRKVEALGRRFLPTVSLQLDYLAPVPRGAWVEGECDVLRVTRSLVFAQGLVTADGVPAARCSGVLKIGPTFGDDAPARA
jgi:uncharacterized protein (TIGR00369 family)